MDRSSPWKSLAERKRKAAAGKWTMRLSGAKLWFFTSRTTWKFRRNVIEPPLKRRPFSHEGVYAHS